MFFKIETPFRSDRKFSQSLIQVTELLGMYHAELARILGQQCGDIGELASGKRCLDRDSKAGQRGVLFINTYNLLFECFDGDGIAMYHWMRAYNKHLNGTPHFLIIDDGKLDLIHQYLLQRYSV